MRIRRNRTAPAYTRDDLDIDLIGGFLLMERDRLVRLEHRSPWEEQRLERIYQQIEVYLAL